MKAASCADRIVELLGDGARAASPVDAARWAEVERTTGAAFPADFVSLVSRTGSVILDEWLTIYGPDFVSAGDLGTLGQ